MAIAVDARATGAQTLAGNVTAATSMSWTHTLGAALSNGILIVAAMQDAGAGSTGVLWDSGGTNVALTQKGTGGVTGTVRGEFWFLKAPVTSGAKTVKVSWSGSHDGIGGSASYSGVDQTTTFNAASPQSATGSTTSSSLGITTTSGEMAVNLVVKDLGAAGSAPTKGASQTYIAAGVDTSTSSIEGGVSDQAATTTTTTVTWTVPATGNWVAFGLSLLPAAGGGATNWGPSLLSDGWNRIVQP